MKKLFSSQAVTTGLAIFSMLFGAGNLMYPLMAGMLAGDQTIIAMTGFFITAVCLPVAGLISMILFDGNYELFFGRLGKIPGAMTIWFCMMFLGPLIAIPRITTLSHTMVAPFIPWSFLQVITPLSSFIFCLIFLGITFLATYRENKIVDILGNYISPALLFALSVIIIKGIITPGAIGHFDIPSSEIFTSNLKRGYETLDLVGALFFASIVLHILKNTLGHQLSQNPRLLAWTGLKAGLIGTALLGIVYIGMSYLGASHGYGLELANGGELFREISFRVLGQYGTAIIAIAVLMACLSTAIALAAVVGEYAQYSIFKNHIGFAASLALVLAACIPLSTIGLNKVLALTGGPIISIFYPVLAAITLCNIAYKLFNFKPIKMPVLIVLIIALVSYLG